MVSHNLLVDAARVCLRAGGGSPASVQRSARVGYATAFQLLEALQVAGVLGQVEADARRPALLGRDDLAAAVDLIDQAIIDGKIRLDVLRPPQETRVVATLTLPVEKFYGPDGELGDREYLTADWAERRVALTDGLQWKGHSARLSTMLVPCALVTEQGPKSDLPFETALMAKGIIPDGGYGLAVRWRHATRVEAEAVHAALAHLLQALVPPKPQVPEVDPYTNPAHHAHVREGHCPVISEIKAWCCDKADHEGKHWTPKLLGPGRDPIKVYWIDEWRRSA